MWLLSSTCRSYTEVSKSAYLAIRENVKQNFRDLSPAKIMRCVSRDPPLKLGEEMLA